MSVYLSLQKVLKDNIVNLAETNGIPKIFHSGLHLIYFFVKMMKSGEKSKVHIQTWSKQIISIQKKANILHP